MQVSPITIEAANKFVAAFHRHSRPVVGALWATSCVDDGDIVGVAIVGRPVARRLDNGTTCEVLRCCCTPDAPRNTNSFLYGAARRQAQAKGYIRVVTYTLQRESGSSLRGAGWLPFVLKPHGQWSCASRPREAQAIYEEPKIRWEAPL